jgi:acylphosphatase
MNGCRCIVAGRVQGVFYRRSAQQVAQQLGLTGSARNLPDGRVEVLAWGEASSIDRLVDWLGQGPALARVTSVEVSPLAPDEAGGPPDHFTTG